MIHKRVVVPNVVSQEPIQLFTANPLGLNHDTMNQAIGSLAMVTKFSNLLNEDVWIINEFNEKEVVGKARVSNNNEFRIDASHSKSPIKKTNPNSAFSIILTYKDFAKNEGMIYVRNLNMVFVLASVMAKVEVQHPYPVPSYETIINRMCDNLANEISSFGFNWWVNEPEPTNKTYYLDFYGNIILLNKSHCEGSTNLSFIAPKNALGVSCLNDYPVAVYNIEDLKHGDIKEFKFTAQNEEYRFFISDSFESLKYAQKKRIKDTKSILTVEEHDKDMALLRATKDDEIDELKETMTKRYNEMESTYKKRIERLEKDNDNLQELNKHAADLSRFLKDARIQESEVKKAEAAEKKEKIALLSSFVKYGATIFLTLASVAAAKKAVK